LMLGIDIGADVLMAGYKPSGGNNAQFY